MSAFRAAGLLAAFSLGACAQAEPAPSGGGLSGEVGGPEGSGAPGVGAGGEGGSGEGGLGGTGGVGGRGGVAEEDVAPCTYRPDGVFVCGPDWLILHVADARVVPEAALPSGSLVVVRPAAVLDSRAYRFVHLNEPGAVRPRADEARGLGRLLWEDAFPGLVEPPGVDLVETRSGDGTRLSWQAVSRDVRHGLMYALRGSEVVARTLVTPRTGGLGVDVPALLVTGPSPVRDQSGTVSAPIHPMAEGLVVQWSDSKAALCPGWAPQPDGVVEGLLGDARFSVDHKLLAILDLVDAVGAVVRAVAPAESWGCVRDQLAGAVPTALAVLAGADLGREELLGAAAVALNAALQGGAEDPCFGSDRSMLGQLSGEALRALGDLAELGDSQGEACGHASAAGFRVDRSLPFEPPTCVAAEVCDDGYDDDCSGAVDDDERCDCDPDAFSAHCEGDDVVERNGCGDLRPVESCDHGCRDGQCEPCRDPTYDSYCDQGARWERNDCGDQRFVQACEHGCAQGACRPCEDPVYERYCDDGDVFERNDCGDVRAVRACPCACQAGACEDFVCQADVQRCVQGAHQTCVGGCAWSVSTPCLCGCDGDECGFVPPDDGFTEHDREGNDDAETRREGEGWIIEGAGRVGDVWSDRHDPVILVSGYAARPDDDWYYLVVDDQLFGDLAPRVLLEPPAGTDLDLRVAYLNNADREFVPECDEGRQCVGVAGHPGCCSTEPMDADDEVRFDAETGAGQENSGVLLIRVQAFNTPNVCDFYTLYIWV